MSILKSFIVFEGLDGAGTTTQIKNLARYYEFNKRQYCITNEPTSNPIGVLVRSVLQKKVVTTPDALALLYAADRSDHLYNPSYGITRMLEEGKIVMSDRYFYSSIAYQSVECDPSLIRTINSFPSPEARTNRPLSARSGKPTPLFHCVSEYGISIPQFPALVNTSREFFLRNPLCGP